LRLDPKNTNLRFLKVVDDLTTLGPEIILISGDLTDKGFGYELVEHYLASWIRAHRLFTVPGNHDSYDMLPRFSRRARTEANMDRYLEFAHRIGLDPNPAGSYVRRIGDVAVIGLNSCQMPRTPLSASGAVSKEQLVWLRELGRDVAFADARLRIALLHHHLLRMPFMLGKRTPIEMGMRLRNATDVMQVCTEANINILFNGHRHHGYMVQLPGHPMVIAAPSSTLGCKTMGRTYAWRIDLTARHPFPEIFLLNGSPAGENHANGKLF
jgi:3',5'-cyclic-AMP phosphodiesterase